ncbi:hypothetical protein DXG01_013457 [Tephrocybe rancida]|nr:hypothetical protein DXG01_013457 [Tephrocybe rancida]
MKVVDISGLILEQSSAIPPVTTLETTVPVVARSYRRPSNTDTRPAISQKTKAAAATATCAPAPASTSKGTRTQAEPLIPFATLPSTVTVARPHRSTFSRPSTTLTLSASSPPPPRENPPPRIRVPRLRRPIRHRRRCAPNPHPPQQAPPPFRSYHPSRNHHRPAPQDKRARNHKRAPSDSGMLFAMSSDGTGSEHPHNHAS